MKLRSRISQIHEIYRPFERAFIVLLGIATCLQVLALITPYFYGRIIDGFLVGAPVKKLLGYAGIMFGLLCLKNLFDWLHGRQHIGKITFHVPKRIDAFALTRIMKLSLGQITNHNSGFKLDIIKKGDSALSEAIESIVFDVIPTALRIVISIVALFCLNVWLGAVTLASVTVFITMCIHINRLILPRLRKNNKVGNRLGTAYWEVIKHLRLVIVNSQEDRVINDYVNKFDAYGSEGRSIWIGYVNKVAILREPFVAIGQFSVLATGIVLVSKDIVSPGKLVMAMAWSMMAFGTMYNIGSIQRRFTQYAVHIGRYFDLLEIPPAVTLPGNPISPQKIHGRIEFRNVSFEYPTYVGQNLDENEDEGETDGEPPQSHAIKNVSLVIEPGETCAFVGHSGAGKSTAVNLILRGYDPDSGQILIDGHDLRLLDLSQWRKSVGCVEQEPRLWDETLAFNMTFGLNGHAHAFGVEELESLAKKTRIDEFYGRLGKKRFQTEIGENGVQLSGGQRQRVAIARAIAKSPSVLILDEATNALDPINERLIHEAVREALVGRTGIIIAHRLSTVRHADRIIVFDKGCVVGNGKHEELIRTCPEYQALVERELSAVVA